VRGRPLAGLCFFPPDVHPVRSIVYVDGFNFYYGCVKGTPWRWLDLGNLCRKLPPTNDIKAIKYFTARVDDDPAEHGRNGRRSLTSACSITMIDS